MASLVGTSSLFLSPSIELTKTTVPLKPQLLSLRTKLRSHLPLAVASPNSVNSVLSEEAFKKFRNLSESRLGEDEEEGFSGEEDYGSEMKMERKYGELAVDKEELAIANLRLPEVLVKNLEKRGITHLFPIQRAVLIPALEGRDLIARAKTGTGKTLAFGIPIIKRLTEEDEARTRRRSGQQLPRALVLAPTRELAKQVEKEIKDSASHLNTVCVYGGVAYQLQQRALSRGVDVVVGTPGRLIDLIQNNYLRLDEVKFLVLDEADQMLAVGFEEDVEVIIEKLPVERQSMLFSATMPEWVKKLSRKYLNNPLTIDLVGAQEEKLAEGIKLYALLSTPTLKRTILSDLITVHAKGGKTIVFTRTKKDADEVSMSLTNSIAAEALHGDISQHQREKTLNRFRQGKFTVLVATDVAARGLDIPNVDLIIHYELPNDPETFVHRSGRTGRAGKDGTAILMFTSNQRRTVMSIERDIGCKFEFISPPGIGELLESSAEHVAATLQGVHPQSIEYFRPAADRLTAELGTDALAAALAQMSGFTQPPTVRSLLSHEQGYMTLQLIREPGYSSGFFASKTVVGFLSDVYPDAADELGKVHLIADEGVQGAVFDLPEEIANELLNKELPLGNSISKITKLPELQDDGPPTDFYGRYTTQERGAKGGRGSGSRRGDFRGDSRRRDWGRNRRDDKYQNGGPIYRTGRSDLSRSSRGAGGFDDWSGSQSGYGRSSSSFGGRDRSFGGACFKCGRAGHRAADCPNS